MGIISGFVQLLGQISAFFLGCTHSGVQTPQRPTLKAALEHTSLPGEEQVWRWCGGPGCGSSGSNRHTGEHTWAQESSTQRGPFLVPREAGANAWAERLQRPLPFDVTQQWCFVSAAAQVSPQASLLADSLIPVLSGCLLAANRSLSPGFALQIPYSST